jgi:hypothetical protein
VSDFEQANMRRLNKVLFGLAVRWGGHRAACPRFERRAVKLIYRAQIIALDAGVLPGHPADVFDYIERERFYNAKRRHSTIGYRRPWRYGGLLCRGNCTMERCRNAGAGRLSD